MSINGNTGLNNFIKEIKAVMTEIFIFQDSVVPLMEYCISEIKNLNSSLDPDWHANTMRNKYYSGGFWMMIKRFFCKESIQGRNFKNF